MKFIHRIRTKIAFGFLIVTLLPAGIIGYYANHVSSTTLLKQEYTSQAILINNQRHNIESFLATAEGDLKFISESVPLTHLLKLKQSDPSEDELNRARKEAEQEFLAFSSNRDIYYQIRYLDETGKEVVRVDSDGRSSHVVQQDKLQNKATRGYFIDTMKLGPGKVFVSKLNLNRERGKVEVPLKPVIRYAQPVRYPDRKPAGIVITNIAADKFLNNLETTILLDKDDFYLNHPVADKRWGNTHDLDHGSTFIKDFPSISAQLKEKEQGNTIDKDSVFIYQKVNIPGSSNSWMLVFQKPLKVILESVNNFQITFAAILAASIILALIIALILASRITGPIEKLTDLADRVSKGRLDVKVDVNDKGEIGELAHAFERMRVSMIKAFDRIRKNR
jgi:methyl-accepting chemotaxis protein